MKREIALGKEFYTVTAHRHGENYTTTIGDNTSLSTRLEHVADENYKVIINGVATPVKLITHGEQTFIHAFGRNFELDVIDPVDRAADKSGSSSVVKAPMPGIMVEVNVEPGHMWEMEVNRLYRACKLLEIGAGTTEIRKIIIAGELLK